MQAQVTVIGGGPGGYVAAARAAQLGATVALVEGRELGGTCLNRGCIPTKALLRSVEVYRLARAGKEYGVTAETVSFDWLKAQARKGRVVKQLRAGVEGIMANRGVQVVAGWGRLASPTLVEVETAKGTIAIDTGKVIIATGSVPARVPIPGTEGAGIITSDEALELDHVPASLVVIGGGAIGLEFAFLFNALGAQVTVVEMLPHVLPAEDDEIADELTRALKKQGVSIFSPAQVKGIADGPQGKQVTIAAAAGEKTLDCEYVLMAVGRTPNLERLGADALGLARERRALAVNERMETNLPGVYAVGDAIGGMLLAHVASAEGKVAAANALGGKHAMRYRAVPACLYTTPEVASVGVSESEATARGVACRVARTNFRAIGKAVAMGERDGLAKIVAEQETGRVLGAQIIGPHATDLVAEAALAIETGVTAGQLAETIHAHPTLSESLLEAAEGVLGLAIHG